MRSIHTRVLGLLAAMALIVPGVALAPTRALADETYQIYPTPHSVVYAGGTQTLRSTVTTVVEDGIDAETQARLAEVLALKGMTAAGSESVPTSRGTTSILVGVKGSGGAVDAYVDQLVETGSLAVADGLFDKTDAYLLASVPAGDGADQLIVLGNSTDAAYYGLTTLYQILQQTDGATLRAFTICDYADVKTRGFIEGYYGDPWSTEDRVNLMTWGGYYKLNAYVYAPKDDSKHNSNWRDLYTEDELREKIDPLAKAGNDSKCRFVYALHPFMSNPITSSNYDSSVATLKAKFQQVMDHGVRQIAILADDAGNQGSALYTRLLIDMTAWIHDQQKAANEDGSLKYPGLKDTIIFCPVNYMGAGESWYGNLPENIQVVNTGNQVWGKIDNGFATRFKANSGRSPFMWINWPCSDNDKDALHMGGYQNFLGSDVTPGSVEGVVLNPMQQSEPSKQAIFMNADFTWNLWQGYGRADQAWEDSYSYVDHNSPVATKGSDALCELSRNMLRMYGGGTTWENGESAAIKDQLTSFQAKLSAGSVTTDDIAAMEKVFSDLRQTARDYKANAGNEAMLNQMSPWVETWEDLTTAALSDLAALRAQLAGDTTGLLSHHSTATASLEAANGHGYHYVNHTEYARVGKAYVTPTVNALADYVADQAELASNPNADITRFVTNRTDAPAGDTSNAYDGDTSTSVIYKSPNKLTSGTYFGLTKTRPFTLESVSFTQGDGKDFMDHAKLQWFDGTTWHDIEGHTDETGQVVKAEGLGIANAYGVRIVATQDNEKDAWPTIKEIAINQAADEDPAVYTGTVSLENQVDTGYGSPTSASDAQDGTYGWFKNAQGKDYTVEGAAVVVAFDGAKTIGSIVFKQDSGDAIASGMAYYQGADDQWHEVGNVNGDPSQNISLSSPVEAKAIKVVNGAKTEKWWKVLELHATRGEASESQVEAAVTLSEGMSRYQSYAEANVVDGQDATALWATGTGSGRNIAANDAVTITFSQPKSVGSVRIVQGNKPNGSGVGDALEGGVLEVQGEGADTWEKVADVTSATSQTLEFSEREVRAIRIRATRDTNGWWVLNEVTASKGTPTNLGTIRTNIEGVSLSASAKNGTVTLSDGTVAFAGGSFLAVDLGAMRNGVTIDAGKSAIPAGASLVYSQNALEWTEFDASAAPVAARFVGVRATGDAQVAFKGFSASYARRTEPSFVGKTGAVGAFEAAKLFDGNVTTTYKNNHGPNAGDTVTFDLGQERVIHSIAYYVPETSFDYIRNAVVEVARTAGAAEWTPVLKINGDEIVPNEFDTSTAKTAAWLTHDSQNPGNMYTANPKTSATQGNQSDPNGTDELDVTARYVRIRFTGTYTQRWVEIGELLINGGEYVSPYGDADVVSTSVEQPGMSPANLIDGKTSTAWAPSSDSGSVTYHVSEPLSTNGAPKQGVRIVSSGTPSNATVTATVYTSDTYDDTEKIELGRLDQPIAEFTFARAATARTVPFSAVKDITVSWQGAKPQVAEVFVLEEATAADKAALTEAYNAAKGTDTSSWTSDSRASFEAAIENAKSALEAANATQSYVDSAQASLESALAAKVERYAGVELPELVAEHVSNDDGTYSMGSYQAYTEAYDAAAAALEAADNLSQADGDALAASLKAARDALAFDKTGADRAGQAVRDAEVIFSPGAYTTSTRDQYDSALAALKGLLANEATTPGELMSATDALLASEGELVDAAGLVAERGEFGKTSAGGYTAESYAAYQKAYDDSAAVLEAGTAEEVATATAALREAKAALVAYDLDAIVADAESLSEDDYTVASWAPFAQALATAKAEHDPAQSRDLGQAVIDARANLVSVVALREAIAAAEAVDSAAYTADSAAALDAAADAGRALLDSGTAEEIEAARVAIANALRDLAPAEPAEGGDTHAPSEGGADTGNAGLTVPGSNNDTSGTTLGTGTANPASKGQGTPNTGDDTSPALVLGALLSAGAVLAVAGRLRRRA